MTGGRRVPPRLVLAAVVALGLVLVSSRVLATGMGRDARDVRSGLIGHAAPALAGTSLAGSHLDLTAFRGSIVLVNVWASWCAPCRDELPLLADAQRGLAGRGLVVLGIDTRDGSRQARELLRAARTDPAHSLADPSGRVAVEWGALGVPETFLIDAAGIVRDRVIGAVSPNWIEQRVQPLLSGP